MTGSLGFIGSNFILYLKENFPDIQITNLDAELIGSNKKSLHDVESSKNYF